MVVYNDQDSLFSFQIGPPVSTAFRGRGSQFKPSAVNLNSIFSTKKRSQEKILKDTLQVHTKTGAKSCRQNLRVFILRRLFSNIISIYVRPKIVQKFKRNLRYSLLAEQRKGLCIHT